MEVEMAPAPAPSVKARDNAAGRAVTSEFIDEINTLHKQVHKSARGTGPNGGFPGICVDRDQLIRDIKAFYDKLMENLPKPPASDSTSDSTDSPKIPKISIADQLRASLNAPANGQDLCALRARANAFNVDVDAITTSIQYHAGSVQQSADKAIAQFKKLQLGEDDFDDLLAGDMIDPPFPNILEWAVEHEAEDAKKAAANKIKRDASATKKAKAAKAAGDAADPIEE
jgi:hypothetical protein